MNSVSEGCTITPGNVNAGPESISPSSSETYLSECTGSFRKSETGGSSWARRSSSMAVSGGRSCLTPQAQLSVPRMSMNSGPGLGSGERVPLIRPSSSSRNKVSIWRSGVLTKAPSSLFQPPQSLSVRQIGTKTSRNTPTPSFLPPTPSFLRRQESIPRRCRTTIADGGTIAHFHSSVCRHRPAWVIPLKITPGQPLVGAIRESPPRPFP